MKILPTKLQGLVVIEPQVFSDARGYFLEVWKQSRYAAGGMSAAMVQDNLSWSAANVLRGLHVQHPRAQAKLVAVLAGEIFDVAVDVRRGSPTFGQWFSVDLSCDNKRQLYVPEGFAHGFCVLSDAALVAYKCSREYAPESELTIRWNDPALAIPWPTLAPALSEKDAAAQPLSEIAIDRLPDYRVAAKAA